MKSIKFKCQCGNMIEFVSQYIEDELLENTCNVKCCKCGLNTNFSIMKKNASNAISLDALKSKEFQIISDFFVRNSKFDTRIGDIFKVKDSIGDYELTRKIINRIRDDKDGNVYNELSLNIAPDTELLINFYRVKNELIFKEMIVNQFVYELEIKQQ